MLFGQAQPGASQQARQHNAEGKSALIAVKTQQEMKFSVYPD